MPSSTALSLWPFWPPFSFLSKQAPMLFLPSEMFLAIHLQANLFIRRSGHKCLGSKIFLGVHENVLLSFKISKKKKNPFWSKKMFQYIILTCLYSYQCNDKIWLIILLRRKGPMKAKMFRAYRSHNMAPAYPIPHLYLTMGFPLIPQPQSPFFGVICLIFPDYMNSLYKFPHYLVI